MKSLFVVLLLGVLFLGSIGASCAPTLGTASQAVQSTDVVFSRGGGGGKKS